MASRSASLAVTAAEHTRLVESPITRDFASSYSPEGLSQQHGTFRTHQFHKYTLRQTSPHEQSLVPSSKASSAGYVLTPSTRLGMMKRHWQMAMTRHEGESAAVIADINLKDDRHINRIAFRGTGVEQYTDFRDMGQNHYSCVIKGRNYSWRPLGPSQTVLEMLDGSSKRIALFMFSQEGPQRSGSYPGNLKQYKRKDIGVVYIFELSEDVRALLEPLLCTVVLLARKAKPKAIIPVITSLPG